MAESANLNNETFSPRVLRKLADRYERGGDIPAKPKATIADLLTLHDLDLGALAHKVGVTMGEFTTAQVDALCDGFIAESQMDAVTWNMMCNMAGDRGTVARQIASTGAKVRAALSAPTIKVATPRVLQSADEAPCGSLMSRIDLRGVPATTLRLWNGNGWNLDRGGPLWERDDSSSGVAVATADGAGHAASEGWTWGSRANGPATLFAEGLTEAECRHLSGLSAADAIAWCEKREVALRG